jgi:hypothetical protein
MTISSGTASVGTAATAIDATAPMPFRLMIHNNDNTDSVYVGGDAVTTSTGMVVKKLEHIDFVMYPGEVLYAVSTKDGHSISWLKQQQ